jgi:hypothetical protein
MVDLVPSDEIEWIVGIERHPTIHFGRAVSAEKMIYVLHSAACLATGRDLRVCDYSTALNRGISYTLWQDRFDQPVALAIGYVDGRLVPADGG